MREICLALPGAVEKLSHGEAAFRAGEKGRFFATFSDHHHDDRVAIWFKAPDGAQPAIVASDPRRFFVPPYWGPSGGVGAWLDTEAEPDWDELSDLLEQAYRMVAGKRLLEGMRHGQ